MKMPKKFLKYPWITAMVFVGLALIILYGLVDLFGSEWVAAKIDRVIPGGEGS